VKPTKSNPLPLQGKHETIEDAILRRHYPDGPAHRVGRHEAKTWTVHDSYQAGVLDGKMEEAYDRDSSEITAPVEVSDLYKLSPTDVPFLQTLETNIGPVEITGPHNPGDINILSREEALSRSPYYRKDGSLR
jgi:hypothetical protein